MPKLIKNGQVAENIWTILDATADADTAIVAPGHVIVPMNVWLAQKEALSTRSDVGVWIDSHETAEQLGSDAVNLPIIAINFPTFMDGRGFSIARLLRERFNVTGEVRAIGHVIRDQLCYLSRCGFDAFEFSDDVDVEAAIASLTDFTEFYQTSVETTEPLFRRRV